MRRSSRDVAQTQSVGPRWGRRDRRDRRVHDVGCRVDPRHRYPRRNDSLRGHRDLYVRSHRGRRTSERIVYDDLVDRGREDAMAAPPHARHGGTRWRLVARWPSRPVRLLPRFRALVNARQRLGEAASDPRKPRRRLSIVVSGRPPDRVRQRCSKPCVGRRRRGRKRTADARARRRRDLAAGLVASRKCPRVLRWEHDLRRRREGRLPPVPDGRRPPDVVARWITDRLRRDGRGS